MNVEIVAKKTNIEILEATRQRVKEKAEKKMATKLTQIDL